MNREIEARLKYTAVDKTGTAHKSVADKMDAINKRAAAFSRQQGAFARSTSAMYATVARYAAPAAIAYGAKVALADFAALERQMTRIGITADASSKQTADAFALAQKVSKELKFDSVAPAIEALDTLVSSGKSLEEAMAFLPSVLATAQASGAATADIANTGLKAADALKIETAQLQRAFDIMVVGGKAGQFELKDMAQYIPGLANSFATLGYEGEDGLKKLVAMLQTIREDTGDASAAATQAQNIFGKMYSAETAKKFSDFGINLRKEMTEARKAGEDAVAAFVRISQKAIDGDLSKLPLLFTDQEFRLGMQSLMTSADSLEKFLTLMNSAEVDGAVWRDVQRVMTDTQSSIDAMSNSWERLKTSFGSAIAPDATAAMNGVSDSLDYHSAVNAGLEKNGVNGFWARTMWGIRNGDPAKMRMAIDGGYSNKDAIAEYQRGRYEREENKPSVGRHSRGTPVAAKVNAIPAGFAPTSAPGLGLSDMVTVPSKEDFKDALKIDLGFKRQGEEAGAAVADGGKEAGKAIEESAAFFKVAGYDVGAAITNAARDLASAASKMSAVGSYANAGPRLAVNADTGRSMPPSAGRPAGGSK